ncbi:hypothetical protein JCM15457_1917 [Liquorilactobacillus sucicola DSM 21376 = JCM 15457]|uniref:AtmA (Amino acid binding protein) n=1 Tax=Liquorilactobacillus sucicola DSM 21376 = JCM 15457 TaxID=1423806 RepID=A0A023CYI8_9LACO|nr:transporter substrate-binding domain-containing protein [Liquorilactobacillus sucicola]KRN06695.1 AtmA (amino acid binding protein) [Liquorilactobacillus sucicola DSM 21376 = JCM 15457]GAJ26963.1 hypothetical protein JCM15457_1917 [Liquorilactobacillus sucicola DSM 21376 = JCM 15457]
MIKKSKIFLATLVGVTAAVAFFSRQNTETVAAADAPRTVQVVGPSASQPYQILKSKDKLSGYNGDVLKYVQKDLKDKYKFQYQLTDANSVFVGLQSGKYDLAVGNYYYSKERAKTYYYSHQASFLSDLRLVVREKDNKINDLKSLSKSNGKLEPIDVADPRYDIIKNWNKKNPKYKVNVKTSGFVDTADQFKDIANKQYDAILYPRTNFDTAQKKLHEPLKLSKSIATFPTVYYYHKSSDNAELRRDVDKELSKLRKNGTLSKLSKKWFGSNPYTKASQSYTDVTKSYASSK